MVCPIGAGNMRYVCQTLVDTSLPSNHILQRLYAII
jgi:hypothetical protein